ncbi:hypothetical protein [Nocardia sp. NPDC049526]|uniref:hypothetical protein n=1 Tax=Nocardia sp. NPDC049526 TaxID=3364316 RepID=UPI003799AB5F
MTEFLGWLRERGRALHDVDQAHVDEWLTTGPSTRYYLRAFLQWAARRGHVGDVVVPVRKSRQHTAPIDADQRWDMARNLLYSNELALPYRVAGLLVLLYAQPMAALAEMTVDQVIRGDDGVYVRLGPLPLHLPEPLDALMVRLTEEHSGKASIARRERSVWLFPGRAARPAHQLHPDGDSAASDWHPRPTDASSGPARFVHTATPTIVSRLLGLSVATAEAWSHTTGLGTYASVIAQRNNSSGT